jgi:hypothetical protein
MRWRGFWLVLAGPMLAVLVAGAAGCGTTAKGDGVASANGGTATPRASGSASDVEKAQQYAQCIRKNGVPNFPDPDPSGHFTDGSLSGMDRQGLVRAMQACQDLAPGVLAGVTGRMTTEQAESFTRFATCMRERGVAVPDPDPNGSIADWAKGWRDTVDTADAKVKAAMETCQKQVDLGALGGGR